MNIINRRKALSLIPPAIVALVPLPAAAKTITVRKVCPVERYWANLKQAEKDYNAACDKPDGGNGDLPEGVEASERYYFNLKLMFAAKPTSVGGSIALAEFLNYWVLVDRGVEEGAPEYETFANLIDSLKQLPS